MAAVVKRRDHRGSDLGDPKLALLIDELNRRRSELAMMIADEVSRNGIAAASSPEIERRKSGIRALAQRIEKALETHSMEAGRAAVELARKLLDELRSVMEASENVDKVLLLREVEVAFRERGDLRGTLTTEDVLGAAEALLDEDQ